MKFIVTSTALLKQLQTAQGFISVPNTVPILENFHFSIEEGNLKITASDLENTVVLNTPVESKESGAICVPSKMLLDLLKTLPEQPLTFTIDSKVNAVEMTNGSGKFKIPGFPADDYPRIPKLEDPSTVTLPAEALAQAISSTVFATGNDDLRPVMSGVYFELGPDALRFVATDAHKLVRYTRKDGKAESNASIIVPKKPLTLLRAMLAATAADVEVQFSANNVRFTFDNVEVVSRLIDGRYPNYEAVIPKENPNKLRVNRAQLLNTVRRVSVFANRSTSQIRLRITGSELSVSAQDVDNATEGVERLTCSYDGDDMEIAFNSRFWENCSTI